MSSRARASALVVFLLLLPCAPAAIAHEGHGLPGFTHTVLHFLIEPVHALPILLAAGAVLWFGLAARRRRRAARRN